jgi:gamma-glutamyltranspeptidase/glutathione hydrolase
MIRNQKPSGIAAPVLAAMAISVSPAAIGQTPAKGSEVSRPWPQQAVRGAHGMVATDEALGSQVGVDIMKRGGNAVDAAVATAFALAVVEPAAGNIGGGGFMLIRLAGGQTTFFDYREAAPGKATRNMYIGRDGKLDEEASVIGYKSVAVPGTVAGLELVLKNHGTMKLADVMAPAIRLAEDGFAVSEKLAHELGEERPGLEQFPASQRIFLNAGRHAEAARVGSDAEAHRKKWRNGILSRRNGANACG